MNRTTSSLCKNRTTSKVRIYEQDQCKNKTTNRVCKNRTISKYVYMNRITSTVCKNRTTSRVCNNRTTGKVRMYEQDN